MTQAQVMSEPVVVEEKFDTVDMNINMGPQHPSTHGVFRMVLTVDGEQVKDVTSYIGYMHRGGEKLTENLDYRGALGYQDRTDYLAAFNNEWVYCNAIERLAGIEAPERAEYVRLILSELNRILSHFMFMGAFGTDVGFFGTAFTWAFKERERIQDLFEAVCGDRMMYNYFRVGGLAWEPYPTFVEDTRWLLGQIETGNRRHRRADDAQRDHDRALPRRGGDHGRGRDQLRGDGAAAAGVRGAPGPASGRALLDL